MYGRSDALQLRLLGSLLLGNGNSETWGVLGLYGHKEGSSSLGAHVASETFSRRSLWMKRCLSVPVLSLTLAFVLLLLIQFRGLDPLCLLCQLKN